MLESTGVYGLDLAFALHRAKRVGVMVANPRAIAAFAKASLQRSKTDTLDPAHELGDKTGKKTESALYLDFAGSRACAILQEQYPGKAVICLKPLELVG